MSVRRTLGLAFTILLLGGLAFAFWPIRFGGSAMFVVVRGESMEPTYRQGELLYTRTASSYQPGDIAVYKIPDGMAGEGSLVVHRIKEVLPDGTYVFQGDNKPSPDDVRPDRAHLIGKPIVDLGDIPTRGLLLLPLLLTLLTGIAVTIALWPDRPEIEDEPGTEEADSRPAVAVPPFAGIPGRGPLPSPRPPPETGPALEPASADALR